ncbi:plasmid mobilization relaxosome protein MobC [Maritalea sp.]|uniref:plasmid mobilization relaxosome protein MobC n=1 Tax=Maritalea sp. TaxID=2003361 RepID=UPI003EFA689B
MSTTDNKFNAIAKKRAKKKPAPFSLCLTFDERTRLEELAGDEPLGSYIKRQVFDGQGTSNKRARSKLRRPIKDDASLAKLLALLGGSRIANNLNQLAKAVNIGSLPVVEETEKDICRACADIAAMRETLLRALGNRSDLGSS